MAKQRLLIPSLILYLLSFPSLHLAFTINHNSLTQIWKDRSTSNTLLIRDDSHQRRPLSLDKTLQHHLYANKANKQELTLEEKERGEATSKATGTKTAGPVLLILVFLLNVWIFSIPPTFRRAHLCSERDTNLYPDKCITAQRWIQGIQDYYRNGGGIQFDFTIEQK